MTLNTWTGKTVTLTGYSLAGADETNYLLTGVGTTTAAITPLGSQDILLLMLPKL